MKLFLYNLLYIFRYFYNLFIRSNDYSNYVSVRAKIGKGSIVNRLAIIDAETSIGNYTFIGVGACITKTRIGNYCSIANSVFIGQGEHDIGKVSTSVQFYKNAFNELTKKKCTIGHDVWIGANVCVLRGVKINSGAVVGAGSVVTKDVPPFAVVVGSPARVIKYRFSQEKIKHILQEKWWNCNKKDAYNMILDIEKTLNK